MNTSPGASSTTAALQNLPQLTVERGSEKFVLDAGETLKPGDIIRNTSDRAANVGAVSRNSSYASQTAKLEPGAAVRVTDRGGAEDEVLGLEAVEGGAVIEEAAIEVADASEYVITPEVAVAQGLFGAVPFLGGLGPAALAALGLAALGSDGDGGGAAGESGGNGGGVGGLVNSAIGLGGGVLAVGDGLNGTPAEPLNQLTAPLGEGLVTVGDGIVNAAGNDPTGLANLLGNTVGQTVSTPEGPTGLVGTVNDLSTGLSQGAAGTPLNTTLEPVTQLLGSDGGATDGVAQGLGNVGSTLTGDTSPIAPVTNQLLGPVVGLAPGENLGLPGTLNQGAEGLTDLTQLGSSLAPLAPVTDGLSTVTTTLSDGVQQAGEAIGDVAAQDPSGTTALLADLLGSTTTGLPLSTTAGLPDTQVLTNLLPV